MNFSLDTKHLANWVIYMVYIFRGKTKLASNLTKFISPE